MKIIQLKKFFKPIFIKCSLITPKVEKPPEITANGWDIYFRLSILFDRILGEIKNYEISELLIVEAGIGYGDTFTYLTCIAEKLNLKIIGFDSFCGFPEPKTDKDQRKEGGPTKKGQWNINSKKAIERKLINSGISKSFIKNNVELVKGYFEDTLPSFDKNQKIIFLHLDVDLYSSYKTCLENLWNSVVYKGMVVFDEYHETKWAGAKIAIDEFFAEKNIKVNIDKLTGRGFVIK